MKPVLILLLFLGIEAKAAADPELDRVRNMLFEAVSSRTAANQLMSLLSTTDDTSQPILICYKGVAQMMMAKHYFNPIAKYSSFKKGRALIEEAIRKSPKQPEIRYLRFMIQTKLPAFLNYSDHIYEDKGYLLSSVHTITDQKLKQHILGILRSSAHCTMEERKALEK